MKHTLLATLTTICGMSMVPLFAAAIMVQQPPTDDTGTTASFCPNLTMTLSRGMKDANTSGQVTELQQFLADQFDLPDSFPSGFFGGQTQRYLAKFQQAHGLPAYGVAGTLTRAKIQEVCASGDTMGSNPGTGVGIAPGGDRTACPAIARMCPAGQHVVYGRTGKCSQDCVPNDGDRKVCPMYQIQRCPTGTRMEKRTDDNGCNIQKCVPDGDTKPSQNPADDPQCKVWFDGCNTCSRGAPGEMGGCTQMACVQGFETGSQPPRPYCKERFDGAGKGKPPVISGFSGPTTLDINKEGTWKIDASDPEGGSLSYRVKWGDEGAQPMTTTAKYMDAFVQTTTFTHTYTTGGVYVVGIIVRDSQGNEAKTTTTVKVGGATTCPRLWAPVCGKVPNVGYKKYDNKCFMEQDGAIFINDGECPGGTVGGGTPPVACTMEYSPVCGIPKFCATSKFLTGAIPGECTNGKTYGNKCSMNAEGAMFSHEGECDKPTAGTSSSGCVSFEPVKATGYVNEYQSRTYKEGETTTCVVRKAPAANEEANMECIADAMFVCRNGAWRIEGGLPGSVSSSQGASVYNSIQWIIDTLKNSW